MGNLNRCGFRYLPLSLCCTKAGLTIAILAGLTVQAQTPPTCYDHAAVQARLQAAQDASALSISFGPQLIQAQREVLDAAKAIEDCRSNQTVVGQAFGSLIPGGNCASQINRYNSAVRGQDIVEGQMDAHRTLAMVATHEYKLAAAAECAR